MEFPCPYCSQHIDIDDDELAVLTADAEFSCPSCETPIVLHPESGDPATPSGDALAANRGAVHVHRGMNRNLLILGSIALLVLGGLAAFIASRKTGDTHNTKQNITNEILHNKFFTDLIASGATTEKELQTVFEIRAHGEGFIGISKGKITWKEAQELALNTGSEILAVDEEKGAVPSGLSGELVESFAGSLGSTVWIRQGSEPKMIDCPDVLKVTTLERPRNVFLNWRPGNQYVKNRSWVKLLKMEPEMPHIFDGDKGEGLYFQLEYNNAENRDVRVFAFPYSQGENAGCDFYEGSKAYEMGSGEIRQGFGFRRAAQIDEVRLEMIDSKSKEKIATTSLPIRTFWKSSQDVELVLVRAPAVLSSTKDIAIPAEPGKRFTVGLTARYSSPRPSKLASNLLMEKAGILPPEFVTELKAQHNTTWHFDTESRPGYGSVNGRGTISYDLTGYAPKEPGTYTFDFNLGLFDKNTWATQVMKVHKVTLNVSNP